MECSWCIYLLKFVSFSIQLCNTTELSKLWQCYFDTFYKIKQNKFGAFWPSFGFLEWQHQNTTVQQFCKQTTYKDFLERSVSTYNLLKNITKKIKRVDIRMLHQKGFQPIVIHETKKTLCRTSNICSSLFLDAILT